ncbi:hypothetical protein Lalb_Chr08g0235821 [Lupinus albus]|uniref:Uncharacterized protein n=1 Tax=Lupinus albus TaxID=3870 RepID=A0A6A4Q4B6_LUPAL|nr:hypothetical protein Lalb_Chr08g0235821 [Lupinus albus]
MMLSPMPFSLWKMLYLLAGRVSKTEKKETVLLSFYSMYPFVLVCSLFCVQCIFFVFFFVFRVLSISSSG